MTDPATPPSRLASLAWSVAFVAVASGAIVGINALMMPYGGGGTLFLGWLLCLGAIVIAAAALFRRHAAGGGAIVAVILLAVASLLYGVYGGRLPGVFGIRETPPIPAAEADRPEHARADVFHFADGRVHPKYHGLRVQTVRRRGSSSTFHYRVAPLVPDGWKESDPVPAWAAVEGARTDAWSRDCRGGYRSGEETLFRELIDETAARHKLTTRGTAPILVWTDDPRGALMGLVKIEIWTLIGVDVALLTLLAVPLLFAKRP
jgi:hypothetical protein